MSAKREINGQNFTNRLYQVSVRLKIRWLHMDSWSSDPLWCQILLYGSKCPLISTRHFESITKLFWRLTSIPNQIFHPQSSKSSTVFPDNLVNWRSLKNFSPHTYMPFGQFLLRNSTITVRLTLLSASSPVDHLYSLLVEKNFAAVQVLVVNQRSPSSCEDQRFSS